MVFCLANDAAGNPGSCSFTLTVTDAEAPVLSCPAGITVGTDDGVCEAVVSFAATAMDNCTANPSVVCMPAPSSVFAKGTTPVNCTTMDAAGNPASCAFNVTVVDDEAPVLTCPANITTTPTSPSGAAVNYPPATVSDNCDTLTATCMPPSGSTFPIGTTTVTCTAADSAGNNATPCTFTVSVVGSPRVTKQNQIAYLQGLYPTITNSKQKGKVKEAIDNLIKSLNAAYWVDNSHLVEPGGYRVFDYEKTAVTKLRDAINYGLNPALVQPTINALVAADRDLAATAIAQAISANGNAGKIAQAEAQLAKGDTEAANNKPDRAIDAYKNAWKYAVAAF
jgi:hypothetical protein